MVRQLLSDGLRETVIRTRLGENQEALRRYLLSRFRAVRTEQFLCIFADEAGFIIREETLTVGGGTAVAISPRHIFRRALTLDCRRILIAHNHPSGSAEPSDGDIRQTARLVRQAGELGIALEDHLIVGRRTIVSMRERGLL